MGKSTLLCLCLTGQYGQSTACAQITLDFHFWLGLDYRVSELIFNQSFTTFIGIWQP